MTPLVRPPVRLRVVPRRLSIFAAALPAAVCFAMLGIRPIAAQNPFPSPVETDIPRIVGRWSAETKGDGLLTLLVYPAPGRQLTYDFNGGTKEHATGVFTLRGANELDFTPNGVVAAEKWSYSFDEQGHLHLLMEEDNPADQEEYILTRVGQ